MSDVWTLHKLRGLNYRELQHLAQENGIKANIKKLDLVTKLTSKLFATHVEGLRASANDDEMMEVDAPVLNTQPTGHQHVSPTSPRLNETFSIEEKSLANSTYILDADNVPKNSADLFLSADESIIAGNLDATQTLSTEKENVVRANTKPASSRTQRTNAHVQKTLSHIPRPGPSSNRFAESHKRLFAKMESIDDAHKKLAAKRQKTTNANEALKRLATPKSQQATARRRFQSPLTPSNENFKFGNVPAEQIESVQKPLPAADARSSRPVRRLGRMPETDVKKLTMQTKRTTKIPTIIPTTRIDQLAVPKSAGTVPLSVERRSYTPNKSPYKYVDTTRMSNEQFRAYQREKKQEQNRLNKIVI